MGQKDAATQEHPDPAPRRGRFWVHDDRRRPRPFRGARASPLRRRWKHDFCDDADADGGSSRIEVRVCLSPGASPAVVCVPDKDHASLSADELPDPADPAPPTLNIVPDAAPPKVNLRRPSSHSQPPSMPLSPLSSDHSLAPQSSHEQLQPSASSTHSAQLLHHQYPYHPPPQFTAHHSSDSTEAGSPLTTFCSTPPVDTWQDPSVLAVSGHSVMSSTPPEKLFGLPPDPYYQSLSAYEHTLPYGLDGSAVYPTYSIPYYNPYMHYSSPESLPPPPFEPNYQQPYYMPSPYYNYVPQAYPAPVYIPVPYNYAGSNVHAPYPYPYSPASPASVATTQFQPAKAQNQTTESPSQQPAN